MEEILPDISIILSLESFTPLKFAFWMPFVHCKFVFNKEQRTLMLEICTATKVKNDQIC